MLETATRGLPPEARVVHAELTAWGHWARTAEERGFSPISPIGRMIEYGPLGAAQGGKPPVIMPPAIARIDGAIARLPPSEKSAVVAYYTHYEPVEASCKRWKKGSNVRAFQYVLRRARERLSYILELDRN